MKQGTIKSLGVIALGAAAVAAGSGSASALGAGDVTRPATGALSPAATNQAVGTVMQKAAPGPLMDKASGPLQQSQQQVNRGLLGGLAPSLNRVVSVTGFNLPAGPGGPLGL
ncbi:hypothetical protein ACQUSR_20075 [Streptomyces sp. P1-3]|uniref:hypothetical protein n=1 Tax=Streptomyces sp. P1-3 TaxID=3421658 RepID=UPI003D35DCE1